MRIDRVKFATELARREMTTIAVSRASGLSRVTVSNIKRGMSCSRETAQKISVALNVPLEQLLENKEQPVY